MKTAPEFRYFHFSVPKLAEQMTKDELEQECESAESYFRACREIQQGINSKETVRYRDCKVMLLFHFDTIRPQWE